MYEEFRLLASIMAYGWGASIIGQVGSVSGNVISLTDDVHPATWFFENQIVDSFASDEATVHQAGMVVTALDPVARNVTVNAIGTTVATDRLVLGGGLNVAPHGLMAGVDDGTYVPNYMNIPRPQIPRWRSYIDVLAGQTPTKYGNASTARRAITGDVLQKAMDFQRLKAGAARQVDQFISNLPIRRMFWNSLSPDRRFDSAVYDGGWEQLKFSNGDVTIPWYADELCYRYTVFGLHMGRPVTKAQDRGDVNFHSGSFDKVKDEELFAIYESPYGAAEWDDATGSQLKQIYSGGQFLDAVGAFIKWYYNVATCAPRVHIRLDDILES